MKNKKLDAVGLMRKIRDNLSKIYNENSEVEMRDLVAIRIKYGIIS